MRLSGSLSAAHSGEEGSVQLVWEIRRVLIKETGRHEAPSATPSSGTLTQRPTLKMTNVKPLRVVCSY